MKSLLISLLIVLSSFAHADEEMLREQIMQKLGTEVDIRSINKTPYGSKGVNGGLYEVYMNDRIHYTDKDLSFLIIGTLVDTKSNENYSKKQLRKYQAIDLSQLPPLKYAINTNKGNGKKTLYIFSDPLCKHCQDLEKYLADYPDLTTYVYLYPNDRVNPGATRMATAIWCAESPKNAYVNYLRRGIIPSNHHSDCEAPFDIIDTSARRIGVSSTPGVIFGDGFQISGTPNPAQLKSLIEATPR